MRTTFTCAFDTLFGLHNATVVLPVACSLRLLRLRLLLLPVFWGALEWGAEFQAKNMKESGAVTYFTFVIKSSWRIIESDDFHCDRPMCVGSEKVE